MITQTRYIQDILEQYGMEQCNPVSTPAEPQVKRCTEETKDENWSYQELIGALMYLAVGTRPDLANTISRLAQFSNESNHLHWAAAKQVLRYLAGTKDVGLVYTRTDKPCSVTLMLIGEAA